MGKKARLLIYQLDVNDSIKSLSNIIQDPFEKPSVNQLANMLEYCNSFAGNYEWDTHNKLKKIKEHGSNVHFTGQLVLPQKWEEFADFYSENKAMVEISSRYNLKESDEKVRTQIKRIKSWPSFWPDIYLVSNIKLEAKPQEFTLKGENHYLVKLAKEYAQDLA